MSFEEIDEILHLTKFFPDVDQDLILMAFSRKQIKSPGVRKRLGRLGFVKMNYQELEFLGDKVLELIATTILFNPSLNAMELTFILKSFVSNQHLEKLAYQIGICEGIVKNPIEKECADIMEAVFGALYYLKYPLEKITNWFLSLSAVANDPIILRNTGGLKLYQEKYENEINDEINDEINEEIEEEIEEKEIEINDEINKKEIEIESPKSEMKIKKIKKKKVEEPIIEQKEEIPVSVLTISDEDVLPGFLPRAITKLIGENGKVIYMLSTDPPISFAIDKMKPFFENENIDLIKVRKLFLEVGFEVKEGRCPAVSDVFTLSKEGWYGFYAITEDLDPIFTMIDDGPITLDRKFHINDQRYRRVEKILILTPMFDNQRDFDLYRKILFTYDFKVEEWNKIVQKWNFYPVEYIEPNFERTIVSREIVGFGDDYGISEVLSLSNGVITPLKYRDVNFIFDEVRRSEEIKGARTIEEYQEIFEKYGFKLSLGKLQLTSAVKADNMSGYYFRIIRNGIIYEILVSQVYVSYHFWTKRLKGIKTSPEPEQLEDLTNILYDDLYLSFRNLLQGESFPVARAKIFPKSFILTKLLTKPIEFNSVIRRNRILDEFKQNYDSSIKGTIIKL